MVVEEEGEVVKGVMVVVVMVMLTVEGGYTAAADLDYDCGGNGGGKIIFGYLSSYQVSLPCLEWFWCCETSDFCCSEDEVFAHGKDLVVVFLLPHKLTWLPY